jgi:protein-S-isoprenylcysteine O-methyltransferase Ste14
MVASAGPNVRLPPPFIFVGGWVLAWWLNRLLPFAIAADGPGSAQVAIGVTSLALGLGVVGWAIVTFAGARTPIVPVRAARVLVEHGPFRLSRNPMYVGLTLAYLGLALIVNTGWALLVLPGVLILLFWAVIRREERHLTAAFPEEYGAYRRRVRRWL